MKHILLSLLFFVSISAFAQHTVVVNPDGTHSVVVNHGKTATIVNPDGIHTTAFKNGTSTTIVNPDGYCSTEINNGNNTIVVGPLGIKLWQVFKSIGNKRSSKKHDRKK